MITMQRVTVDFDGRSVLDEVTLELAEKRIGVVGANGSGKSTFARLLNGLVEPSSGTVEIDGLDTVRSAREVRKRVGFVFQNPDNQIVCPTVEEDLAFGLKHLKLGRMEADRRVTEVLERYSLAGWRSHPAHLLSGGQKQLLAIAGVLVVEPKYVVLDEPTTLLDLPNRQKIMRVLSDLEQTVVLVTHDLDLLECFDRVIVIHQGRIACDDTPDRAVGSYMDLVAAAPC